MFQLHRRKINSITKMQVMRICLVIFGNYLLIIVIALILLSVLETLHLRESVGLRNIIYFVTSIVFFLLIVTNVMITLSCTYYQLHAINGLLVASIDNVEGSSTVQLIRQISIMHDKLCDVCDATSLYYLLNNLVFNFGFMYFNIFFCYLIYILIWNPSQEIIYFAFAFALWLFFYMPGIFYNFTFVGWIEKESSRMANLIQFLVEKEQNLEGLRSSQIMLQQVKHRSPKFSCALYDLNWKAFFHMIGSIFSFTIILIQFYDVAQN